MAGGGGIVKNTKRGHDREEKEEGTPAELVEAGLRQKTYALRLKRLRATIRLPARALTTVPTVRAGVLPIRR